MKQDSPPQNWALAEERAAILMKTTPQDARAYAVAGDIFLHQDKRELARDAYREAVRYEKNILLLWEQLLRMEIAGGNFPAIASISPEELMYFPDKAAYSLFHWEARVQLRSAELLLGKGGVRSCR